MALLPVPYSVMVTVNAGALTLKLGVALLPLTVGVGDWPAKRKNDSAKPSPMNCPLVVEQLGRTRTLTDLLPLRAPKDQLTVRVVASKTPSALADAKKKPPGTVKVRLASKTGASWL
ncbi:MAG: hypothetical protein BWX73_00110 [Lentisphaerae bacterium ADurb.Bin082]|nr:MAG: hypothetical protein BWX73_00110 [Lentisphaerae bacterium ADurb.Bin082]